LENVVEGGPVMNDGLSRSGLGRVEYNTVDEVSHEFELELGVLVTGNYQLTLEGIRKLEAEEIDRTQEILQDQDAELVASQISWQHRTYDDMRRAASDLALVGLVTRLQHWIEKFLSLRQVVVSRKCQGNSKLAKNLQALNEFLNAPCSCRIL
jgi:hypothetical protein